MNVKETVELQPTANGGEMVIAEVSLHERALNMELTLPCYGCHSSKVLITFDKPEDMRALANALNAIAMHAEAEFAREP